MVNENSNTKGNANTIGNSAIVIVGNIFIILIMFILGNRNVLCSDIMIMIARPWKAFVITSHL